MTAVEKWVRDIVEDTVGGSPLEVGKRYVHPEHGLIEVVGGQYWGERGLSNHWHWIVVATGEKHNGYGENWPEATS